jgi:hypothetical protein
MDAVIRQDVIRSPVVYGSVEARFPRYHGRRTTNPGAPSRGRKSLRHVRPPRASSGAVSQCTIQEKGDRATLPRNAWQAGGVSGTADLLRCTNHCGARPRCYGPWLPGCVNRQPRAQAGEAAA